MKLTFVTATLLALVGSTGLAQAGRALKLTVGECTGWSAPEVERLVRLELATVGGGESDVGSAEVSISCMADETLVVATEPRSRRSLTRTVPLAKGTEDAERVLAISVAQLVRALDWLPEADLEAKSSEPVVQVDAPAHPHFVSRPFELHLGASVRVRELPASLVTRRMAVGSGFEVARRVRLGGGVSYERGGTSRRGGQVETQLLGAGVSSSIEPLASQTWSCLLRLELSLQHLSLRGSDAEPGIVASQVRGFGGEASAAVGPALRWGDFGLALLAQVGGSYFGGQALVSGDRPVSINAAWAGTELAVLWTP